MVSASRWERGAYHGGGPGFARKQGEKLVCEAGNGNVTDRMRVTCEAGVGNVTGTPLPQRESTSADRVWG